MFFLMVDKQVATRLLFCCASPSAMGHNEKHRNQLQTDYGAKIGRGKEIKNPIFPKKKF